MAEDSSLAKKPKIDQQLTLRSGVCSVDIKDQPDVVFKDKEIKEVTRAHRSVLSRASPFFNTWFKEQWQKEKDTTEYPVPGDIDWEIFTNVIAFLYGKEVKFEEETLPKIYNAADFLQLENLKVVIVVSLTDKWKLKDPSIVGAMCTAIAPHTDPRVVSGLLYMVSVRYLIKNIPTIVQNDDIDISPLPFDTVMEIAQSEEVAAPEIQLYHFLRKWTEKYKHYLPFMDVQNLFGQVRYATIPYPQLEAIRNYDLHNNKKLQSALNEDLDIYKDEMIEIKQYINRKSQEGRLLLNGPSYKKWTTKVTKVSSSLKVYTVISDSTKGAVVITCIQEDSPRNTTTYHRINFEIISLTNLPKKRRRLLSDFSEDSEEDPSISFRNTVVMRATPTGIQVEKQDEGSPETLYFAEPFPWLVTICGGHNTTLSVQTV